MKYGINRFRFVDNMVTNMLGMIIFSCMFSSTDSLQKVIHRFDQSELNMPIEKIDKTVFNEFDNLMGYPPLILTAMF